MKRRDTPWLVDPSDKELLGLKLTHFVYFLQMVCFLFGFSCLIGFFINRLTLKDLEGTWLESHYHWQIRTFWYACGCMLLGFLLAIVGIGFLILFAVVPFVLYRAVVGWLALWKGEEIGCSCPVTK